MINMKKVLIISDGKPGHLNQSKAFCRIKGYSYDIVEVQYRCRVFKALSYLFDKLNIFTLLLFRKHEKHATCFYDAIVSTGSTTYYLNKAVAKKCSLPSIVLMLPKSYKYSDFTYIVAQEHDNPPMLDNVIKVPLNLSYSEPKKLIKKSDDRKAVGIIIGGDNSVFKMKRGTMKRYLDKIFTEFPDHSKYVTTSRRTPKEVDELLAEYHFDYALIYSKNSEVNPISDFLDICDELFITIDSTSMLSEARANSDANINIIELDSTKKNTKYHKLANIVENINERVDFNKLLERIEL